MSKPLFKPCLQHQPMLLPPSLDDLIPENAMVRLIDRIIDGMDRALLESVYPGGGAPAHDPAMMLKVVLLAYASGIYSSRKIARATAENINFLWLCGMHPLDHNTINRFRSKRIRPIFEDIFTEVISVAAKAGHITLETYFLDGTKIEANANKYSFVWKRSTDRYQEALRKKVHAHLAAIDELEDEAEALAPEEPKDIDSETIARAAARINERLKEKKERGGEKDDTSKKMKSISRSIKRDWLPRMEKYEQQQKTFAGRNSYSKTDTCATFMRLKDDAMKNGQTKAAYNIQAGTENQFIIDVTVHQRPTDTACMIDHLEHVKSRLGHLPKAIVADAGYGSEENYLYLEKEKVHAFVKHNEFFRECKNKKWRKDPMRVANWDYNSKADVYTCPEKRPLLFRGTHKRTSQMGFVSTTRIYECIDCSGCPLRKKCFNSKDARKNKRMEINRRLVFFKRKASALLHTKVGSKLRKRRSVEVETVFGDIKRNMGFTRFSLRGLDKVTLESRLIATGHNLRKLFSLESKKIEKGVVALKKGLSRFATFPSLCTCSTIYS